MNRPETPPNPEVAPIGEQPDKPQIEEPIACEIPETEIEKPIASKLEEPIDVPKSETTQPLEASPLPTPSPEQEVKAKTASRDHSPVRLLLTVSVYGFIILFLFLRTFAIEPFGVPTGSMAPASCWKPQRSAHAHDAVIRYEWVFLRPVEIADDQFGHIACPNCGKKFSELIEARDRGRRSSRFVDKNVFNPPPGRGDGKWPYFAVPDTDPKEFGKPYVKRVIGLPNEIIRLIDGDVYANDLLVRKELPEVRETRVPVFDMAFVPDPGGSGIRGGWSNPQRMIPDFHKALQDLFRKRIPAF